MRIAGNILPQLDIYSTDLFIYCMYYRDSYISDSNSINTHALKAYLERLREFVTSLCPNQFSFSNIDFVFTTHTLNGAMLAELSILAILLLFFAGISVNFVLFESEHFVGKLPAYYSINDDTYNLHASANDEFGWL